MPLRPAEEPLCEHGLAMGLVVQDDEDEDVGIDEDYDLDDVEDEGGEEEDDVQPPG